MVIRDSETAFLFISTFDKSNINVYCSGQVPPGTNGGVSPLGLLASVLGGFIIGASAMISIYFMDGCNRLYIELILVASIAGLIGSIIDSILGATVQISLYSEKSRMITNSKTEETKLVSGYDLLDNNQ
ncbi:34394_t:CDS:2, partial [Gigaspora margarita]